MKIAIGSDHRGFNLKDHVKKLLAEKDIKITDVGAESTDSVDYPDFSWSVTQLVGEGKADFGILICGSGIGMSIAANKVPRIRAALCLTPAMAKMSRNHNNANVLVLGADLLPEKENLAIVEEWLKNDFERVVRHKRRIQKIHSAESYATEPLELYAKDPDVYEAIQAETRRIQDQIILIASENLTSRAVREAQGSVLTNKYAEGYPGRRWYHGCENMDTVEQLAIDRAKQLFGAEHANVQPHSGTNANLAVYMAVMEPGDSLLAMKLAHGGHLSHGHPANYSGRMYKVHSYGVSKETEQIDYDEVEKLAKQHRPKMIVAGCSAYSRIVDFKRFREIADSVGALLMADMAHIAGLIAAGCHPNPVPCCDFVTSTTHKTLGGPRGAFILCRERFAAEVDKQIFPGLQGGPLMHVVAAKGTCFLQAMRPSFRKYQQQIVKNSKALCGRLADKGFRIVSGGTDNHLFMVDLSALDINGQEAADRLSRANIICNKNTIPFETKSPQLTSGIRLGTPTVTARGMGEPEMKTIGDLIAGLLQNMDRNDVLEKALAQVKTITAKHPAY